MAHMVAAFGPWSSAAALGDQEVDEVAAAGAGRRDGFRLQAVSGLLLRNLI